MQKAGFLLQPFNRQYLLNEEHFICQTLYLSYPTKVFNLKSPFFLVGLSSALRRFHLFSFGGDINCIYRMILAVGTFAFDLNNKYFLKMSL